MQVYELIKKLREFNATDCIVLVEINGKQELIQEVYLSNNNPLVTNIVIKAGYFETKSGKHNDKTKANGKR